MTDRLAPGNDAAGQNNWADIDDDDEDWVPGEIQWNDGTKVTIPQVDEPAAAGVLLPACLPPPPGLLLGRCAARDRARAAADVAPQRGSAAAC